MKRRTAQEEVSMLSFDPNAPTEPLLRRAIRAAADAFVRRPSAADEAAYQRRKRE